MAAWGYHNQGRLGCGCISGEDLHKTMERFTILNGKTHELSMAIFNSKVLNYQRVIDENWNEGKIFLGKLSWWILGLLP